jgi:hypothetical protein
VQQSGKGDLITGFSPLKRALQRRSRPGGGSAARGQARFARNVKSLTGLNGVVKPNLCTKSALLIRALLLLTLRFMLLPPQTPTRSDQCALWRNPKEFESVAGLRHPEFWLQPLVNGYDGFP